jgi:pimeloyl-ACP methyl ester carboxylesterase
MLLPDMDLPEIDLPSPPAPPARNVTLRVGGLDVHAVTAGRGPDVVLLHGLGGIAEEVMAPLAFLARDYRLTAFDRPGYGSSGAVAPENMAQDRQAEWLAAALSAFFIRRPVIVAHSLSAGIALWYALRHPDRVSGLVLVSPYCRPTMPAAMPLLRLAVAPVVGRPVRLALPLLARGLKKPRLAAVFRPNRVPDYMAELPVEQAASPPSVLAMAAELRAYNRAMIPLALRVRRLRVRTVIVAGERDGVAETGRHAAWLASRLPESAGVSLSGAGHMAHHVRPAMVAAALESARNATGKSAFSRV